MKYKGIELIDCNNRENELCCSIESAENQDIYEIEDDVIDMFEDFGKEIVTEVVLDNYMLVRCWDIKFDQNGIDLLKSIYDKLSEVKNAKVCVDVHTDEWFTGENGEKYNQDTVSWEEFMENLEYLVGVV